MHFTSVESDTYDVLEEGRQLIKDTRFDRAHGEYFYERIEVTVKRITTIKEDIKREHQRYAPCSLLLKSQICITRVVTICDNTIFVSSSIVFLL